MAAAYAALVWGDEWASRAPKLLDFATREEIDFWVDMARRGVNSPVTTSAGRLFDAAACAAGLRGVNAYEGQAACELEGVADPGEAGAYAARVERSDEHGGAIVIRGTDLFAGVADDTARGVDVAKVAARFHNGFANALARACDLVRDETGIATVALSGGVFQNALLLTGLRSRLERGGLEVLTHSHVPTNDGGIAFGQTAVAAARAAAGTIALGDGGQPPGEG
ncbi:MAG: Kae1-like domain-containing protein, partial [Planctomycetota bacterium]|jgi:hydrogenase maturation protein HypF